MAPREPATAVPGLPSSPLVCLSMIVRDEALVLERCLTSALPILDAAVICDTGSSDDTPQLAARVLARHGVPFRILSHPWRDFGTNRTAAIRAAEVFAAERDWPPDRTHWLWLDADHELQLAETFHRGDLTADATMIRQQSSTLSWWNYRFGRASLRWSAVGRTHEHYVSETPAQSATLDTATVLDHADGGTRAGKCARDIAWLTRQLDEKPDDPRTLFYLAQSYLGAGDPLKALRLYQRRAGLNGNPEEAWYARLSAGRLLAHTNDIDTAAATLAAAHAQDPTRAEPLLELARLHRTRGDTARAMTYARLGRSLPRPAGPRLFVHTDAYDYELDLELARAGSRDAYPDAFAACERVTRSRTAPAAAVDEARTLMLPQVTAPSGLLFRRLQPRLDGSYRPCNPSIIPTADGYVVNCRAVNYEQRRLHYTSLATDGVYRTTNILMTLDREFNTVRERTLTIDSSPLRQARVRGLEDVRLVAGPMNSRPFTCCTTDRHPSGHVHQSIGVADADGQVVRHCPLTGSLDAIPQKNWLPFVDASGRLLAIHSYDPLRLVSIDPETGRYEVVLEAPAAFSTAHWRGSAGPIAWPVPGAGQWLVLVHEIVLRQGPDEQWERVYLHRFAEYDGAFRLQRASRPFIFAHKGVEFSCGMTMSHDQQFVVIGIGIEDREAHLGRLDVARIEALLDEGHAA